MKAYDVYKRALNLLGYVDSENHIVPDDVLQKRAIHIINQTLTDLKQGEIENMNMDINIPKSHIEALIWGTAMFLSVSSGDADKNRMFSEIYNSKRMTALCECDSVIDKMPNVSLGEM